MCPSDIITKLKLKKIKSKDANNKKKTTGLIIEVSSDEEEQTKNLETKHRKILKKTQLEKQLEKTQLEKQLETQLEKHQTIPKKTQDETTKKNKLQVAKKEEVVIFPTDEEKVIYRIGRHINISLGFVSSVAYAYSQGCSMMQIFLGAPQQVLSKKREKSSLLELSEALQKYNMLMVVHGAYTINLAHPPANRTYIISLKALIQDLEATQTIGENCLGVIIHMGKNIKANDITDEEAMDNYVRGLKEAIASGFASETNKIILETGASQGSEIGSTLDGLKYFYDRLTNTEKKCIGFCIDTCHIWATGYNISNEEKVKKFHDELEKKIGWDKVVCIHFNDSQNEKGSCVDRHADIGDGKIGEEGLRAFAMIAKKYQIPLLTETPLDYIDPKTYEKIKPTDEIIRIKKWYQSR
jgi:deoxyribonuclease-4